MLNSFEMLYEIFSTSYSSAIVKAMNISIPITFIMRGNINLSSFQFFKRALLVISFRLEIANNKSRICTWLPHAI